LSIQTPPHPPHASIRVPNCSAVNIPIAQRGHRRALGHDRTSPDA
jgi:hypothetical protein